MNRDYFFKLSTLSVLLISLTACASTPASKHKDLNVQSITSNSIFLDPTDDNEHTIFLQIKNTTTQDMSGLTASIKQQLTAGGWTIVRNPAKAHDLLQVNVLQFGLAKDSTEVKSAIRSGYGSLLTGALVGVGAGYLFHSSLLGAGAGIGVTAWLDHENAEVKTYSIISDVEVSVRSQSNHSKTYNTRIASIADKYKLTLQDATPVIIQEQAKEIAGIFVAANN